MTDTARDLAFEQECADADQLLRLLGLDAARCRTEGGAINIARVKTLLSEGVERPCTCHPDDNPPKPCARQYALSACRATPSPAAAPTLNEAIDEYTASAGDPDRFGAASLQRVIDKYPQHAAGLRRYASMQLTSKRATAEEIEAAAPEQAGEIERLRPDDEPYLSRAYMRHLMDGLERSARELGLIVTTDAQGGIFVAVPASALPASPPREASPIEAALAAKPVKCLYCKKPDDEWRDADLVRGKRSMGRNLGIQYHCIEAFYGAS